MLRQIARAFLRVRLTGELASLSRADVRLMVANHLGALDPLVLACVLPRDVLVIAPPGSVRGRLHRMLLRMAQVQILNLSEAVSVRQLARLLARGRRVALFPANRIARQAAPTKIYEAPAMAAARSGVTVAALRIQSTPAGVTVRVGPSERIELPSGLPARERRRLSSGRLQSLMQRAQVQARERQTLFESLIDAVHCFGRRTSIIEDIQQVEQSYGAVLKLSLAIGRLVEKVTREREIVGVLMPNTVATVAMVFGMSAKARIPAMLNYSAGVEGFKAALRAAGIRRIVTSRRFISAARLERLVHALSECELLYVEDLRQTMSAADKLWLVGWALWQPRRVMVHSRPDDVAVVLFTSGSEGKPKGVALSHDGVHANMAQLASAIDFGQRDKFLNALPMYHTYGLIACTLMPIVYGTRLFLYTNPLHYRVIPEIAYTRDCTYLFGTSTFLGQYGKQARALDFSTVRYVISGGEKLNPEVQKLYQDKFGLRILEGYGATECGPAMALNTPQHYRAGTVGGFLPEVEWRLLPVAGIDSGGVLHVRSPNLMLGYLLPEHPGEVQPPSSELGSGWYNTNDLAQIDGDGFVTVVGRLKRFAKVAGEMVALESVERVARTCSPEHLHAATVGSGSERGETTILFTTDPMLDRMRLHQTARALGMQDLAVARQIVHVQTMPVLGTGKTDYVALSEWASGALEPQSAATGTQPVAAQTVGRGDA